MKQCPDCGQIAVQLLSPPGVQERSQCSICGWEGPRCFGMKWDAQSPKCQGGADPTHWDESTHVRPKCSFEPSCGAANPQKAKEQLQPMTLLMKPKQKVEVARPMQMPGPATGLQQPRAPALVRQHQQAPTAHRPMLRPHSQVSMQHPVTHHPQQQVAPPRAPVAAAQHQPQAGAHQPPSPGTAMAWVPPDQAQVPAYVPQNYQQPGMQVPAYLTAPEPQSQGVMSMIMNSCARAALKGAFHTAANLVDHVPWGGYVAPPPAGPAGVPKV